MGHVSLRRQVYGLPVSRDAAAWASRGCANRTVGLRVSVFSAQSETRMLDLFALLVGAIEGLGKALERERVGRLRSLDGNALHHGALAGPQGIDQPRFFRHVLDPGAVLLGVERERGGAYDRSCLRIRLER